MHILLCITSLSKQGGAQKIFSELCVNLAQKEGTSVEVVSLLGGYYESVLREQKIRTTVVYKGLKTLFVFVKLMVYLIMHKKKYSLIHAFMPHGAGFGTILSYIMNKSFVYAIRNSSLDLQKGRFFNNTIKKIFHEAAIKRAINITVNSISIQKALAKETSKNVILINNCVIKPPQEKCINQFIQEQYFSTYQKTVVSVCNMRYPQKDILTFIDVAVQLQDIGFVVVGAGPSLALFKEYAREQKASNVAFTGHVENVYPYIYYSNCSILLTNFEGFPNTLLESMILEKPVLASDIPELRETLAGANSCTFVPNKNTAVIAAAIRHVLQKENDILEQIARALHLATTQFSVEKMVNETMSLYEKCIRL